MRNIPLSNNETGVLVDDEDYWFLRRFKWAENNGYASMKRNGQHVYMHRLIMMPDNDGIQIDHKNGNKLDNRKQNLRFASHRENQANRPGRRKLSTGFKGVQSNKDGTRFYARISVNDKTIALGGYSTAEEAAKAYDLKAVEIHGEFAWTNFPLTDYIPLEVEEEIQEPTVTITRTQFLETARITWENDFDKTRESPSQFSEMLARRLGLGEETK